MNLDLLFAILFYGILFLYFITHKKRFQIQGKIFALYKTKFGLKLMDKIANIFSKPLKLVSYVSVFVSALAMVGLFLWLVYETIALTLIPNKSVALAPIIPGVKIPGLPVLPFWYFIIGIFIVAVIHEFSHGVYARVNKIKIKSSGFAFLGPILAAFVEPDEKQLNKKPIKAQLDVFSAGPFSNIVLAVVVLLISGLFVTPFAASFMETQGVQIYGVEKEFPMQIEGFEKGEIILEVNNEEIKNTEQFISIIKGAKPDEKILIKTDKRTTSVMAVKHPQGESYGYIGIIISPITTTIKEEVIQKYGSVLPNILFWFIDLLKWIFILSLGIGLFNLLPLGPIDGGRILYELLFLITKDKMRSKSMWKTISLITLFLVITQILTFFYRWIF